MTDQSDRRPLSPYLIGPYYRPQLTSMLSIASRMAGLFATALTLPAMFIYLLCLAAGPDAFEAFNGLLSSLLGKAFCIISLFCLCYHLANGIRHLVWDTGRALSLKAIYTSGYVMVAGAIVLFLLVIWRVTA